MTNPSTQIGRHTIDKIFIRGESLVDDLIGKLTFTEMMYFQLLGRRPSAAQAKILAAGLPEMLANRLALGR